MRILLFMTVALPLAAQTPALTPFQAQKARTILATQLPCLGCHELDGEGGRVGPSLTTVAERRSAEYIRAMIDNPQNVVPGSAMPRTPMPASTRDLVIRFLSRDARNGASLPVGATTPLPSHTPNPVPQTLYQKWCASCHGITGQGDGSNAKFLPVRPAIHSSATAMSARSDDVLYDAIAAGGSVMGKSARMPAFGATLSPSEIRSIVTYIRTLCACSGPAWSRDGNIP